MAEISQTNLAAYQNKRIPEEDIRGKILREKQAALQDTLGKYQIDTLKENQRVRGINRKSEDWLNRNADLLFANTANPLDIESQVFNNPDKVSEMYERYKKEVGGNFAGFNEFINMGKTQEARSNYRQLMMSRDEFETEREWKQAVNQQLLNMEDGERTRLFSMLDEDSYAAINDIYNVDEDEYDSMWEKYGEKGMLATGITLGIGALQIARGRWKGRQNKKLAEEILGKTSKRTGFKGAEDYKDFVAKQRELKKAYIRNELEGPNARPRKEIIKEANKRFKLSEKNYKDWKYDQSLGGRGDFKSTPDSELQKQRRAGFHKPDKPGKGVPKNKQVQILDHRGRPIKGGTSY